MSESEQKTLNVGDGIAMSRVSSKSLTVLH